MCWSLEASATLASIGIATTAYAAYKKEPTALWIALGYFSLMEMLQAFTYSVIDKCELPANQIATMLGYLHITFQPFFVNSVSLHFISDDQVRAKVAPYAYTLCFIASILMLLELYPFSWAPKCNRTTWLCSDMLCSVSGNWHIAWLVPLKTLFHQLFSPYAIVAFILPVLYGSWKMTLYHILVGPLLARLTTNNWNEVAAVWCLFSIGLLLIVLKTPVRNILFVRSWFLWPLIHKLNNITLQPRPVAQPIYSSEALSETVGTQEDSTN